MQTTFGFFTGAPAVHSRTSLTVRALALTTVVVTLASGCAALPVVATSPPAATSATLPPGAEWTGVEDMHVRFAVPAGGKQIERAQVDGVADQSQELLGVDDDTMDQINDEPFPVELMGGDDVAEAWTVNARSIADASVPSDADLRESFDRLRNEGLTFRHVHTPIGPGTWVALHVPGSPMVTRSLFVAHGGDVLNVTVSAVTPSRADSLAATVQDSLYVTG